MSNVIDLTAGISKAFGVLGDEQRRRQYDVTGDDPTPTASGIPRGGGFGRTPDFSRFEGDELSPEDILNFMFGGGAFGGSGEFDVGDMIRSDSQASKPLVDKALGRA